MLDDAGNPERKSQVSVQIDAAYGATDHLHEIVDRLAERLERGLRVEPEKPTAEDKDVPALCAIATAMRDVQGRIHSASMRIEGLLNRLEV